LSLVDKRTIRENNDPQANNRPWGLSFASHP
jgi:hypothetical protein